MGLFPHLVQLHNSKFGEGLRAIAVNIDYHLEDLEKKPGKMDEIRAFVTEQKAYFPNIIYKMKKGRWEADVAPEVQKAFFPGVEWDDRSVPLTLVIGRDGKLFKAFAGAAPAEADLDAAAAAALARR